MKNLNNKFKIFHDIIILCNYNFILQEIILGNKGLYSVSYKTNGIKIELKNCKLETPLSYLGLKLNI